VQLSRQFLASIPNGPAVYGLYAGRGRFSYVAYIGMADILRRRIRQHLMQRENSVAAGASAVCLNPDCITKVEWWSEPDFKDRTVLAAAELAALRHFDPVLRSRSKPSEKAKRLADEKAFEVRMYNLFTGPPTGQVELPSLHEALRRLDLLERRVAKLEARLKQQLIVPPKPI
jgi:hypothetical protein